MIYLKFGNQHLLILEPGNLKKLEKDGLLVTSPDKEVAVAYTPDPRWLSARLKEALDGENRIDPDQLEELLEEGMKREPGETLPYHEAIILGGKRVRNEDSN